MRSLAILTLLVPLTLAPAEHNLPFFSVQDIKCLATNIHYESRGEPVLGQIAVARVTMNRAKDSSICTEVYRYKQFSWTLKKHKPLKDYYKYLPVIYAAHEYDLDATHFHTLAVKPKWSKKLEHITTINNHKFYK